MRNSRGGLRDIRSPDRAGATSADRRHQRQSFVAVVALQVVFDEGLRQPNRALVPLVTIDIFNVFLDEFG
jgi:hypothetical protein